MAKPVLGCIFVIGRDESLWVRQLRPFLRMNRWDRFLLIVTLVLLVIALARCLS